MGLHAWRDGLAITRKHLVCGVHSGFPPCCVAFFSLAWFPLRMASKRHPVLVHVTRPYIRLVNRMRTRSVRDGWGRLPCPLCVFRDNPTIPIACSCWERSDMSNLST